MFEREHWIANKDAHDYYDGSYLFRKSFTTDRFKTATLYISCLGYGIVSVNGIRVTDDVLTTPFSRFDKTTYYNEYDITDKIIMGDNVLSVHLGNGWYNDVGSIWDYEKADWRCHSKLIAKIILTDEKGVQSEILSDTSFKSIEGPAVFNHVRCGEIFDNRLMPEGWSTVKFDDSNWQNVKTCRGPGGVMKKNVMTPSRITKTITPKKIGDDLYDLGQNISGWARIKARGAEGSRLVLKFGEVLNEDNSINERINMFNKTDLKHSDEFILRGRGVEEFAPSFEYHGFRYIKVSGDAELLDIKGEVVYTDFSIIGDFSCSDEMLNKIHTAARWSTLTNFQSIPTDCPHREQNGWTGDALISCEQSVMNYDMMSAYVKWLDDIKDVQRPNGQVPGIVPTSSWGYNWANGPAWDSAILLIPYQVYKLTGDTTLIKQMWDNLIVYMEYMQSMAVDYLADYGLGDHCPPPNVKKCPAKVTDTAFFYACASAMAEMCPLMNTDGEEYSELAYKIRVAYRKEFLPQKELLESQTFIACGLYYGMYDEEEIPQMAEMLNNLVINNDWHIDCGILGNKFIYTALSENGYAETLYKMITNPTMPSYAYWINSGMTTFCELWSMVNADGEYDSLNHHMYSEVDMWFYKYVAGIRLNKGEITIKPCFISQLESVSAHHNNIRVEWDRKFIKVDVPKRAVVEFDGKSVEVEKGHHVFMRNIDSEKQEERA